MRSNNETRGVCYFDADVAERGKIYKSSLLAVHAPKSYIAQFHFSASVDTRKKKLASIFIHERLVSLEGESRLHLINQACSKC